MSQSNAFLVNVPGMHPDGPPDGQENTPPSVRFMNPGLETPGDAGALFTPPGLPMAPQVVKAMLAQFAQLARESRSVADISAFAPGQYDDFYSGGTHAIKDELAAAASGRAAEAERARALSRAQTELCLAWALEEYSRELAGLGEKLGTQWESFTKSLGLDEEDDTEAQGALDPDQAALAGAKPNLAPDAPRVPAAALVGSVLAFLPGGCGLWCADKALLADWEEFGVSFAPASPGTLARFGLTGPAREALAPGYRLCLSRRADPSRPWLDAEVPVLAPAAE